MQKIIKIDLKNILKKFGQKKLEKKGGVKQIWSLFRDRHTHTSPLYIDQHWQLTLARGRRNLPKQAAPRSKGCCSAPWEK